MKKGPFLAALLLFLNFGLVSCSSKKGEQAQETAQEEAEEQDTDMSQESETAAETSNAQAAE